MTAFGNVATNSRWDGMVSNSFNSNKAAVAQLQCDKNVGSQYFVRLSKKTGKKPHFSRIGGDVES